METGAIERMRSFNRTVTQRLGAPDDEHLARGVASEPPRPLGARRGRQVARFNDEPYVDHWSK